MSAKNYASRNIRGKLRVCRYLSAGPGLSRLVPATLPLTRGNLSEMLAAHTAVYVKPDVGSLGIGVAKVRRTDVGYELKEILGKRQVKRQYHSSGDVYEHLARRQKAGKELIVQQAIALDRVKGLPYDIRVMVQRKPAGSWSCTGFMVKIGAAGKIVTNYYQGGSICTLRKLHGRLGLAEGDAARRSRQLADAALSIAKTLSAKRSGMHELGIDFAYDTKGKLWVLEVNSNHPQFHPLKKLDPESYGNMMRYAASYGRFSAK